MGPDNRKSIILVVDDDEDDRFLMEEAFAEAGDGHKVISVANGVEAIDALSKFSPDNLPCLIILDLNMPLMDGEETLHELKQNGKGKDIPVVVFSTSNSPAQKLRCLEKGATDFITKTWTIEALKGAIRRMLTFC